jgi:phosphate transport system substrate-binding protein
MMRHRMLWTAGILGVAGIALGLMSLAVISGCGSPGTNPNSAAGGTRVNGAGSSFVNPIMLAWAKQYREKTGVEVDYTSVGSTKGITEMSEDRVAFGCTDAPMTEEQLKKAGGDNVLHIPLVMGAVVPIYHLDGIESLHLTGGVLARIYLDKITRWNDDQIKAINKDVALPDEKIVVVRRADGSGTSFIFTSFLYQVSPEWKEEVGKPSTNPAWKTKGLAKEKNPGVAQAVVQTPNSIGYVDLRDAIDLQSSKTPPHIALVANQSKTYVPAELASIKKAAEVSMKEKGIPDDMRKLSIINPKGDDVYPICGTVYAICKVTQPANQGKALSDFLRWCLTEGQRQAGPLHYAELPEELAKAALKSLDKIK